MRFGLAQDGEEQALRDALRQIVAADPWRMAVLRAQRRLVLPDGWIGAGFVRAAVWDHLHGLSPSHLGDVDVVWFDQRRVDPAVDRAMEEALLFLLPGVDWSVRNQARMHLRNNDDPYGSVADALRHWPETATAVAMRLRRDDVLEILAPFGLADLFGLRLRPTPSFAGVRWSEGETRIRERGWQERWPKLRILPPPVSSSRPR